ncbi:MAG: glutamate--tRNA ligase [Nitrososphaerota archaeon]|nr:glutamate--tRNA ligase [Aigarchaeota archaeon]MDW8077104.1 glutamate--tRNA ligase [Nitrososphaerota archaeon]
MEIRALILKWALKNAIEHDGKAVVNAVVSKVLGENPELRNTIREVLKVTEEVVKSVNQMGVEQQIKMLEEIAPALLEKHKPKEKKLPPLPHAKPGKVVTRLPPEPSGYMHIGHAMSGILNYMYAKMYDGKLWLRFEDTNPRKVKLEYYENFRKGYKWFGIEWDYEKCNSEDLDVYYDYAKELITMGFAYVCSCSREEMSKGRFMMTECAHRQQPVQLNLSLWKDMLSGVLKEGSAVLRLKGDMTSKNTVMRDPALFRIIEYPHPIVGDKYRVWPTYDIAAAIEDAICGVTHVLRSSEFALRDELQNYIRSLLGLQNPVFVEYSRFEFKGTPLAKREIRRLIEQGIVSRWDDPRLATVDGIRRRGLLPEAIREFTISQTGLTFTKRVYVWELLYAINRRMLDPIAKRYFIVPDPILVEVEGAPELYVELPYHPSEPLGKRLIRTADRFYIAREDVRRLKEGDTLRLKYLYNISIKEVGEDLIRATFMCRDVLEGVPIVQWVTEDHVEVRVFVPDVLYQDDGQLNPNSLKTIHAFGENACVEIKHGERVQFERFGFCIRDSVDALDFVFIHS